MQVQGTTVNGSSSVYTTAFTGAAAAAQNVEETTSLPSDSASVNAFSSNLKEGFDYGADLNKLYSQKSQAESEKGQLQGDLNSAQSQISERKQQIIQEKAPDKEGDAQFANVKKLYDQSVQAQKTAQTELNNINKEVTNSDRAINTNAQMQQTVSSKISAAQGRLSSLRASSKSGGGQKAGEAGEEGAESKGSDNSAAIAQLEQEIRDLQAELDNLKKTAQDLQTQKASLDRQKATKQTELNQLNATVQTCKAGMDEYQNGKAEDSSKVSQAFENDKQLQQMQKKYDDLQAKLSAKDAEIASLNSQIAEAESKNEGLQNVREEQTDREFQEAAKASGFNAEKAESRARNSLAQEEYGKSYEELALEEQMAIEARADGMVTLEALEHARKLLEKDPENAAAQAVIEKGARNLDAQMEVTVANLGSSFDSLPADLQEGALAAMQEARDNAAEGADPETAAMEALAQYIVDVSKNPDLSDDEIAAVKKMANATGDYLDAMETMAKGNEILQKAAESYNNSELAAMKADLAAQMGVSVDQLIVLSGTDGNDEISIRNDFWNGGLYVTVNGEEHYYTAEEAKYLIINGGAGDDSIAAEWGGGVEQDLHIFGGAGNDFIRAGEGNDMIYGGAGEDRIFAEGGNDFISGGAGNDEIDGGDGDDVISGGAGNDLIGGGNGNDVISGDEGDDEIYGGAGNDIMLGGLGDDTLDGGDGDDSISGNEGDDKIYGRNGNDHLDGGDGDDTIEGGKGDDFILGGDGKDTIKGDQGKDIIYGGLGDDDINGGADNDLIFGEQGNDTIHGGGGDDIISGGDGDDHLYGDNGSDKIYGNAGNDYLDGYTGKDMLYGGEGEDKFAGNTIFENDFRDQDGDGDFADFDMSMEIDGEEVDMATLMALAAGDTSALEKFSGLVNNAGKVGEKAGSFAGKVFDPTKIQAAAQEKLNLYQQALQKVGIPQDKLPMISERLNQAGLIGGILRMAGGVGGVINGVKEQDVGKVASGSGDFVSGTSTATGAFKNLYHGSKISAKVLDRLGTFSKVAGGVGGAITAFSGIWQAIEGGQNGDGWQTASGVFQAISGVAGIAAAIPGGAAIFGPIAIVCSLIHWGIDYFNR